MTTLFLIASLSGCGGKGDDDAGTTGTTGTSGTGGTQTSPTTSGTGGTTEVTEVSQEDFLHREVIKFCEKLVQCGSGYTCEDLGITTDPTTTSYLYYYCRYDADAALACLQTPWTCDDSGFPVLADVCADVFECRNQDTG